MAGIYAEIYSEERGLDKKGQAGGKENDKRKRIAGSAYKPGGR